LLCIFVLGFNETANRKVLLGKGGAELLAGENPAHRSKGSYMHFKQTKGVRKLKDQRRKKEELKQSSRFNNEEPDTLKDFDWDDDDRNSKPAKDYDEPPF
jgi:hypothetical protein